MTATEKQKPASRKKIVGSLLFMGVIIALTFYLLFKDQSPAAIFAALRGVKLPFILLGLLCMLGFVSCEAVNIHQIQKTLQTPVRFLKCLKYAFVGFFFSSITPSASGGQPAQVYYMKKDNISIASSTLTLLVVIVVYQLVMVLYAAGMLLSHLGFLASSTPGLRILMVYGFVVNILLIGFITAVIFHDRLVKRVLFGLLHLMHRIRLVKQVEKYEQSLGAMIDEYREGAKFIRKNKLVICKVFLATVLQITLLYLVPYFVYLAFGLSGTPLHTILATQSILTIAVSSLPLPGAAGASEGGFLSIFKLFFAPALILPAMLIWRGISFYALVLISGAVCVVAQLRSGKRDQNKLRHHAPQTGAALGSAHP